MLIVCLLVHQEFQESRRQSRSSQCQITEQLPALEDKVSLHVAVLTSVGVARVAASTDSGVGADMAFANELGMVLLSVKSQLPMAE